MKVLILNSLYEPYGRGGAERSVQIMAESLASRGHSVAVVCTGRVTEEGFINGVRIRYRRIPNLYWLGNPEVTKAAYKPFWHALDVDNFLAYPTYKAILEDFQPDILHTNNLAGLSVSAWRAAHKSHIPVVHTLRDHYLLCPKSTMFHRGKSCHRQCWPCKIYSSGKKRQDYRVSAVVGISKYILNKHLDHGYFRDTAIRTCIHNPVRPAAVTTNPHRGSDIRIGYAGRLSPEKGVEVFLDQYSRVATDQTSAHVYGQSATQEYLNSLTRKHAGTRVTFHGHRSPEQIYPNLDALVVPSLVNEAFGRIVPEANSYGVPVIASNRGALPEIVRENENGFIFDPDRPDSLATILRRLVSSDDWRREMPAKARRYADRFSADAITDQYEALYHEVMQ